MADANVQKRSGWYKGVSGNPNGRPKGAKSRFTKIREDWLKAYQKNGGVKLFSALAKSDPHSFLKIGTQMLPKDANVDVSGQIKVRWLDDRDSHTVQTS